MLWKYNYGKIARGAPLIADGKLYIGATNARFDIIKLNGDTEPDENKTNTVHFRNRPGASGFVEVNSTPSVADGRVYISTRDEIYCIAQQGAKPTTAITAIVPPMPPESPPGPIAQIQVLPADVVAKPGETLTLHGEGVRRQRRAGASGTRANHVVAAVSRRRQGAASEGRRRRPRSPPLRRRLTPRSRTAR